MNVVFQNTSIGPLLTLRNAATSIPSAQYLRSLPGPSMYLAAYRRMFRLRRLVGRSDATVSNYQNVLRRRITKIDFNVRRSKVLGIDLPISQDEMAHRLANTIAFIFNSTCNKADTIPEVQFFQDLKRASETNMETSVVATILQTEHQKPHAIKYDFSYKWVDETRQFYQQLEQNNGSKKEINRLYNTGKASYMGFLQYEMSVMGLNQTHNLLL